ncbi:MAG: hypothetical protein U0W24_22305 [Bacteroidales bacterium]
MKRLILFILLGLLTSTQLFAQVEQDTAKNNQNPVLVIQDTSVVAVDSALILAREKFVRDSIYHRKLMLDSLTFLKQELPGILEAAIKSNSEELIISIEQVKIIGDSVLSNYSYTTLFQKMDEPYSPWRPVINLSGNTFKIKVDTLSKKILSLNIPEINYTLKYDASKKTIRMEGQSTILKKDTRNYYKLPIDSVFFDTKGRVKKIKKYISYFEANSNYKKGALLFSDVTQIKEYEYFADGLMSNCRIINYCDRWGGINIGKVCYTDNYAITRQGNKFTVKKTRDPNDVYIDGTLVFEFDANFDLKSMEFTGADKNLNKKCILLLNKDRYVTSYLYEKDGVISKSLLINYFNSKDAKYKYETISCSFEKDGISYYQKNLTTGKSRTRDKLTLEWGPWK